MDNAIVVTVNVVLGIRSTAAVFFVARHIGEERIAVIEAVGNMPVIVNGGRSVFARCRLARICDQAETNNDDDRHYGWENCAALKAHFLALALLSETGDLFC